MIWGFIKLSVFTALALFAGVLFATVPVGGQTVAARARALWARPAVRRQVHQLEGRVKRGVHAAVADPPRATRVDAHKVARVLPDRPPGDDLRPSERQAVRRIIARGR